MPLSHNQTKLLTSLQVKKYRHEHRMFIVEGEKMVAELLSQDRLQPIAIWGLPSWSVEYKRLLTPFMPIFNPVTTQELQKISAQQAPNKVLATVTMPPIEPNPNWIPNTLAFYLDGLQDPGNMGTILRVADWFGVHQVFCSPDCVDVFSPKVVQASMGAILRLSCYETELAPLLKEASNCPLLGAVLGGDDVFTQTLPPHGLLVIGNEGRGIRPEVEALLTHRLSIARHPEGKAESLNAAVATGIITALLRNLRV